jgi:hypothetical protein
MSNNPWLEFVETLLRDQDIVTNFESLVHPLMLRFLEQKGMTQEGFEDQIESELGTYIHKYGVDGGKVGYTISPFEASISRVVARVVMDAILKSVVLGDLGINSDGEQVVTFTERKLFLLFVMAVATAFGFSHEIGPMMNPGIVSTPALTAMLFDAMSDIANAKSLTEARRMANEARLTYVEALSGNGDEDGPF